MNVFKDCPSPLEGKTPTFHTIAGDPQVISKSYSIHNGRVVREPLIDEATGNPYGADHTMAEFIGNRFKTNHFNLRRVAYYDYFHPKLGRWLGRPGSILYGKADLTLGFPPMPQTALEAVDISGYLYFNRVGFSSGHSKVVVSLYNAFKPFT